MRTDIHLLLFQHRHLTASAGEVLQTVVQVQTGTGRAAFQAVLVATALLIACLWAIPSIAQQADGNEEPTTLEQTEAGDAQEAPTHKAGYTAKPVFAGPNSPEAQLEEDDRIAKSVLRFGAFDNGLRPWFDWKKKINEKHGLQITGQYVTLYQGLSDSLTDTDSAWSGLFRLTTSCTLVGRGTGKGGSLVLMLDHRHAFTDVAPAALAGEAGYRGITGLLMNDIGLSVVNLNWQQWLKGDNTGLIAGRFDPNDYMNVLGYANPWTAFQNLSVVLDSSIAYPDSSWGVGVGHWFTDRFFVLGSINDANGAATDNLEFFEGGAEFFTQAGIGWSPSKSERYTRAVIVTGWHVDERQDAGIDSAHGMLLSANWNWNDRWMLFFRSGWSEGTAPIYNRSLTGGVMYHMAKRSDTAGFAVNWGNPSADSLSEQATVEAFYRLQLAQNLAITPSVQALIDPALNPENDLVWVIGLRLRFTY